MSTTNETTTKQNTGRPKGGYKNAAGKRIPGVTTILGRFKDSGGLIQWAYNCGRDGIDINEAREAAMDAGTATHELIDAHLHHRVFDERPYDKPVLERANHAFLGFLEWSDQNKLTLEASEISLVSERYQFGGTFDAAMILATRRLLDYKSSSGIYTDHLLQVAGAYSILWQEHFPDKPLHGIDLLRVSKPDLPTDPVSFEHRHWSAEIIPIAQRQFILLREAYELDKRLKGLL